MDQEVFSRIEQDGNVTVFDSSLNRGGIIEISVEGNAAITSALRLGLFGRYGYLELNGESTRTIGANRESYDLFIGDGIATVGLNLTVVF